MIEYATMVGHRATILSSGRGVLTIWLISFWRLVPQPKNIAGLNPALSTYICQQRYGVYVFEQV